MSVPRVKAQSLLHTAEGQPRIRVGLLQLVAFSTPWSSPHSPARFLRWQTTEPSPHDLEMRNANLIPRILPIKAMHSKAIRKNNRLETSW